MSSPSRAGAFFERTLASLGEITERHREADALSQRPGFLQRLDPRAKLAALLLLIVAAVVARTLAGPLFVLMLAIALAWWSLVPLGILARLWIGIALFTGVMALPALFLTPGNAVAELPALGWTVTDHGLRTAALLLLRGGACATLALLLVLTTPWTNVLKALRAFRVPAVAIVILGMTYRYAFLLLQLSREQWEARRCRMVGHFSPADRRRLTGANAGVLLGKSLQLGGDVFLAMQARGFQGNARTLDDFRFRRRDWLALAGAGCVCLALFLEKLRVDG